MEGVDSPTGESRSDMDLKERIRPAIETIGSDPAWRVVRGALRRTPRVLVLLWHRIDPAGPRHFEIVRSLPSEVFDAQLTELASIGDIRTLDQVANGDVATDRPTFALTFDDDWMGYNDHVVPVLKSHGLTGTFFLSGRMLDSTGPTWWEALEFEILDEGFDAVCARLGITAATPGELAGQAQGTPLSVQIEQKHAERQPAMTADEITKLIDDDMQVAFHTRGHRDLPTLDADELASELRNGRDQLAELTGEPIDLIAYPHGRTNAAVEQATRKAGYRRAFTTTGRSHKTDGELPFEISRWDPVVASGARFRTKLAKRLLVA